MFWSLDLQSPLSCPSTGGALRPQRTSLNVLSTYLSPCFDQSNLLRIRTHLYGLRTNLKMKGDDLKKVLRVLKLKGNYILKSTQKGWSESTTVRHLFALHAVILTLIFSIPYGCEQRTRVSPQHPWVCGERGERER